MEAFDETEAIELDDGVELVEAESTYDQLYPTMPAEDDPYPDEIAGELLDDLEEFAEDEGFDEDEDDIDEAEAGSEGEEGDDASYDFEEAEFFMAAGGDPERVSGDAAVIEWLAKAVTIEPGFYPIYPLEYGCNLRSLVGAGLPAATFHSEVGRMIRECAMFHPRIAKVEIQAIQRRSQIDRYGLFVDVAIWLDSDEDEAVELSLVF